MSSANVSKNGLLSSAGELYCAKCIVWNILMHCMNQCEVMNNEY